MQIQITHTYMYVYEYIGSHSKHIIPNFTDIRSALSEFTFRWTRSHRALCAKAHDLGNLSTAASSCAV
jgi:hypothetical protein